MRTPKPGEGIWQCPQCGKLYYVKGGTQMHCQKYRLGNNGRLYERGGCDFFGSFKWVGGRMSEERAQWKLREARRKGVMRRVWGLM